MVDGQSLEHRPSVCSAGTGHELATERGDLDELRRLADRGSNDALDQLIELAAERDDLEELRRLADAGSATARGVLEELTED